MVGGGDAPSFHASPANSRHSYDPKRLQPPPQTIFMYLIGSLWGMFLKLLLKTFHCGAEIKLERAGLSQRKEQIN